MTCWNIIVAAFAEAERSSPAAEAMRAELVSRWEAQRPLQVRTVDAGELEEIELDEVDAVVVLVNEAGQARAARALLAAVEEAGPAILVLLDGIELEGKAFAYCNAAVQQRGNDAVSTCGVLEGLLLRQPEVRRLRKELTLAHRFHGGLRGEITRMHEELQLAAMVQREFLPRELPSLGGVEFAALWRPAHYVSGDIYDVVRLDRDHVGIFIADAVGHGVPAALMTMVVSRSLTPKIITGSSYRIVPPAEVLDRLNRDMIRRQGRSTRFATAAYAVLNCRARTMSLACAGHPPPLMLMENGGVRLLETAGGLLGVFKDETYDQIDLELSIGDRMLMYSDGFEQAFPKINATSYERRLPTMRYRDEFATLAEHHGPAELVERLSVLLNDQQGSLHQIDDLTLICMQAGPLVPDDLADESEEIEPEGTDYRSGVNMVSRGSSSAPSASAR
jgi:sigma-B regulation protein RsbU (phosphoserine phosphatase)